MSNEERRVKTRERVRAWKKDNYWRVLHQRKRRWQRTLATRVQTPTRVRFDDYKGTERKPVREVQETHYETDDEAYEREHPRVLPPKMEPAQEVVASDVIRNTNMRGRAAPETSQQLLKEGLTGGREGCPGADGAKPLKEGGQEQGSPSGFESRQIQDMTPEERRAAFNVMKRTYQNAGWREIGAIEIEMP